jgi:C-5 cytosine-specific DNA methylase
VKPLAIDLFCGLGGWAEGFLAEGYRVIGFDIERRPYPAQLVLQDVATLDGRQFAGATAIVASPPCQAYSYRAMPWKRAKELPPPDNTLFDACFRIQREASEAAGRYIPMVVENVRGAQRWIGTARWKFGSYYLWGDVPAIMPFTESAVKGFAKRFEDTPFAWYSSRSDARKQASAEIAKIPFDLARHIASVFRRDPADSLAVGVRLFGVELLVGVK